MLAILAAIRDALVALALAWVGFSLAAPQPHPAPSCGSETCQERSQQS